LEEATNAFNDQFLAAAGRDRVVPEEANAVLTASDEIDSLRGPGGMFLGIPGKLH